MASCYLCGEDLEQTGGLCVRCRSTPRDYAFVVTSFICRSCRKPEALVPGGLCDPCLEDYLAVELIV